MDTVNTERFNIKEHEENKLKASAACSKVEKGFDMEDGKHRLRCAIINQAITDSAVDYTKYKEGSDNYRDAKKDHASALVYLDNSPMFIEDCESCGVNPSWIHYVIRMLGLEQKVL